jgi:hypothetical protein
VPVRQGAGVLVNMVSLTVSILALAVSGFFAFR